VTDDNRRIIEDSLGIADEALNRVRAISVELRPAVLDDVGLEAAVIWYARRQAERAGYELVLDAKIGPVRLPEDVETASFRIVQQALTNIARHAGAMRVRIALWRHDTLFDLEITDDGTGFDVEAARLRAEAGGSLGLLDMQELATLAGGTLTITSHAAQGTKVHARFRLGRD
jgi:signal transduction histidine kinase